MNSHFSTALYHERLRAQQERRCDFLAGQVNGRGERFEDWKLRVTEQARREQLAASLRRQRPVRPAWWLWRLLGWAAVGASCVLVGWVIGWVWSRL